MFTLGIFTTHIPYIAFVAFYAFFVLFGVEKASSDKLTSHDNEILAIYSVEFSSAKNIEGNIINTCVISASAIFAPGSNETILPYGKYIYSGYKSENFNQLPTCLTLFCRPPPAFI